MIYKAAFAAFSFFCCIGATMVDTPLNEVFCIIIYGFLLQCATEIEKKKPLYDVIIETWKVSYN